MTYVDSQPSDGTDPESITLPEPVGARLQTAFGFESRPETVGEWWERLVETFEADRGRSVATDDLCDVDDSPHAATLDGETTHYVCAQDPLVVGLLADDPVTVRSEPPTGDGPVTIRFEDGAVTAEPESAVLSFGIDESVEPIEGPIAPGDVYGLVCPHGHAFPDSGAYDRWAADASAVSFSLPVDEGLGVMALLIDVADLDSLD